MFENPYNHPSGTVCVIREIGGRQVAFKIIPAEHWPDWGCCFTIL
jgi:hypothetical protein